MQYIRRLVGWGLAKNNHEVRATRDKLEKIRIIIWNSFIEEVNFLVLTGIKLILPFGVQPTFVIWSVTKS